MSTKSHVSFLTVVLSLTILSYMLITPHVGTSYNFYAHQVQVIRDGYPVTDYPVVTYILYAIDLVVNDITTTMNIFTVTCLSVCVLFSFYLTEGKHIWLCLLIPFNPYTFMLTKLALIRNIASLPLLLMILLGLKELDKGESKNGAYMIGVAVFGLFLTHNLSLMVGALLVATYVLLTKRLASSEKLLSLLAVGVIAVFVILLNMESLVPWMVSNLWVNWPRIFESVTYVSISLSFFNFILVLLFTQHCDNNNAQKSAALTGLLLLLGSWVAPIGIDMRLVYYTPVFLLLCLYSNVEDSRYVGIQIFGYLLMVVHFFVLLVSSTIL